MSIHAMINRTPYRDGLGFCLDARGMEHAVAVLKATFQYDSRGVLAVAEEKDALPVYLADEHFAGGPAAASLCHASDIVHEKPGTDVAVNGAAYGRGRTHTVVGFRIGGLTKQVVAFGKRTWCAATAAISAPQPFDALALRYEMAYGGSYVDSEGQQRVFAANPVGVGYSDRAVEGLPLPSLEVMDRRITTIGDRPPPAGLGFIPPGWSERYRFAGTFDRAWQETRRPLLPLDFDPRFYNAVPQDQVRRPKLVGCEPLELWGLDPHADRVELELPQRRFSCTFRLSEGEVLEREMELDTLLVESDRRLLALSFRASCAVPGSIRRLRAVELVELS